MDITAVTARSRSQMLTWTKRRPLQQLRQIPRVPREIVGAELSLPVSPPLVASPGLRVDGAGECKTRKIHLRLKVDVTAATYEIDARTITHFNDCILTAYSSPPCGHCVIGASHLSDTQTQSGPDNHSGKCYLLSTPQLSETVRMSLIHVISDRWRTETWGSGARRTAEKVVSDSPSHTRFCESSLHIYICIYIYIYIYI